MAALFYEHHLHAMLSGTAPKVGWVSESVPISASRIPVAHLVGHVDGGLRIKTTWIQLRASVPTRVVDERLFVVSFSMKVDARVAVPEDKATNEAGAGLEHR